MHSARPAFALDPKRFGRGPVRQLALPVQPRFSISDDVKLFATTFLAGFLFVSILIG